ncbi:hypothetical protein NF27_AP00060 [Candidatus Jidaibacter acanthamoeba]|uniref:Uncharacterized protein n=1 Tax=Candidatus Jidaibacter acanthamoebae TaxID=86105 RepID=A0A0C1QQV3_9RICK|nr:hypothetical protein [Candidatus Jidaibacter acanthamoeba]KIE06258.1 hypothetical protein NF27_AP00060 [Candidatus Jidaibacter acanthamoeba]
MKNNEKHTNQEKPNSKKRVSWVDSIEDNEGRTLRVRKKAKVSHESESTSPAQKSLKNYFAQMFSNGHYDVIKQEWESHIARHTRIIELKELYGEDSEEVLKMGKNIIGKLLCLDNYSMLRWVTVNCDIEAFKLIAEMSATKYLQRMVRYDDYMAFRLFVSSNRINENNHEYNSSECIEGFKLFLKIDNNVVNIFWKCLNITDSIKSDFDQALKILGLEHLLIDNKENNSPNHINSFTQRIFNTAADGVKITRQL